MMVALACRPLGPASLEVPTSGSLVPAMTSGGGASTRRLKVRLPPAKMRAPWRQQGAAIDINGGAATVFQRWRAWHAEAVPEAASTEVRGKVHHRGYKFINGRHHTSPRRRPTPPFLCSKQQLPSSSFSPGASSDNVLYIECNERQNERNRPVYSLTNGVYIYIQWRERNDVRTPWQPPRLYANHVSGSRHFVMDV